MKTCVPCPINSYYSPAGGRVSGGDNGNIVLPTSPESACRPCPDGTFSAVFGGMNRSVCQPIDTAYINRESIKDYSGYYSGLITADWYTNPRIPSVHPGFWRESPLTDYPGFEISDPVGDGYPQVYYARAATGSDSLLSSLDERESLKAYLISTLASSMSSRRDSDSDSDTATSDLDLSKVLDINILLARSYAGGRIMKCVDSETCLGTSNALFNIGNSSLNAVSGYGVNSNSFRDSGGQKKVPSQCAPQRFGSSCARCKEGFHRINARNSGACKECDVVSPG